MPIRISFKVCSTLLPQPEKLNHRTIQQEEIIYNCFIIFDSVLLMSDVASSISRGRRYKKELTMGEFLNVGISLDQDLQRPNPMFLLSASENFCYYYYYYFLALAFLHVGPLTFFSLSLHRISKFQQGMYRGQTKMNSKRLKTLTQGRGGGEGGITSVWYYSKQLVFIK